MHPHPQTPSRREKHSWGWSLALGTAALLSLGQAGAQGWEAEMASTKLKAQGDFPSLPAAVPSVPPNTQDPSLWVQHRVLDPSQLPAQPTAGWMSGIPSLEAVLPELRGHIRTRRGGGEGAAPWLFPAIPHRCHSDRSWISPQRCRYPGHSGEKHTRQAQHQPCTHAVPPRNLHAVSITVLGCFELDPSSGSAGCCSLKDTEPSAIPTHGLQPQCRALY